MSRNERFHSNLLEYCAFFHCRVSWALTGFSWNAELFIWVLLPGWHWDIFVMVMDTYGKSETQDCLSACFCCSQESHCFFILALSNANRKSLCRKWRHFRKWTNYLLSACVSCRKACLKVVQCLTVYF